MDKSQVYAKHLGARISPKKMGPVIELIKGKDVKDAKLALKFDVTKGAELLFEVLKSAEANAKHNEKLDPAKLYVSEVWIGAGPTMKRMRLVAKSRASSIFKRTANIYVGLSERKK